MTDAPAARGNGRRVPNRRGIAGAEAPRVRVYELARELDLESANVLRILARLGIEARTPASSIDARRAAFVRASVRAVRQGRGHDGPTPDPIAEVEAPP